MLRTLAYTSAAAALVSLASAHDSEGTTDTYAASSFNKTYADLTATWFYPSTGSCGWTNTSTQFIASILPPEGATNFTEFCGQTINVTNLDNGASVLATVVDECTGCRSTGYNHFLNLSPAAFKNVSTLDTGVFNAKWHVVDAEVPYVAPEAESAAQYTQYSGADSGYTPKATWTKVYKSSAPATEAAPVPSSSSSSWEAPKVNVAAAPEWSSSSSSSSEWQAPAPSSSSSWSSSSSSEWQATSSSWTPEPSSSSPAWSSSSSSASWTPSSSWSSSAPAWTPSSSSSSSSTPAWTPSSSSSQWTPSSSSTPAWTPSSSTQQAKATQASWSGGATYNGEATFFYQKGNPGACGNYNSDSTPLVAMDYRMYDSGAHCGQQVYITRTDNGKSVTAVVADMCPSCVSSGSLDLSTGAFNQIATASEGMVPITWHFV